MKSRNKFNQAIIENLNNTISTHTENFVISANFLGNVLNLNQRDLNDIIEGKREFVLKELKILSHYFQIHIDNLISFK